MVTSATGTDLNIIGRTEMGDFRNGRSRSIICIAKFDHLSFCKFTIVRVIFYHSIFALHGFDFRTCLQNQCSARRNTAKESLKELP